MLYPLKFKPYLKFYPYGGRRFVEVLHKEGVPAGRDVAETWEIADHGDEQSVVSNGPLAGRTLRSLMEEFGAELVGDEIQARYGDYFPLLIKFLDCDKRLPAHMHPNDAHAERLGLSDKGKTEAWYIVKSDAGANAYIGMRPGLTAEQFADAIENGDTYDGVMNKVATTSGETYFVPSGRLHGLGEGNLAFEVQQNSDAGFAWDWAGFVESGVISGEKAAKHPQLAIECAYYEDGAQEQTQHVTIQEGALTKTFCCASRYFVLEKLSATEKFIFRDDAPRFNTLTLIGGAAIFRANGEEVFARRGESLLIPAEIAVEIEPNHLAGGGELEMLRCYVPDLEMDVIEPLRAHDKSDEEIAWLGSYGQGNDLLRLLGLPPNTFLVTEEQRAAAIERGRDSRDETS